MKASAASVLVLSGIILALAIAAVPSRSVSAQMCTDPAKPNNPPFPCPEEKKRPTVIYPSFTPSLTFTPTPTVTHTPTSTPAVTATPTATEAPPPVTGAAQAGLPGGFTCPPYANSIPLGAAALGAGLLLSAGASRRMRLGNHRDGALNINTQPGAAPPGVTQSAVVMGSGAGGSGAPAGLLRWLARMSPRDPASGLPSMNQGTAAASGAAQLVGTAVTGLGAGLLGAGLFGGLLDLSCISPPIVITAGGLIATAAAFAIDNGIRISNSGRLSASMQNSDPEEPTYSTFVRVGTVDEGMEVRSGAGIYKNRPLE